jgi:hypothetical protein
LEKRNSNIGGRTRNLLFIFVLVFLIGENLTCKSEGSKDAAHKIDDCYQKG